MKRILSAAAAAAVLTIAGLAFAASPTSGGNAAPERFASEAQARSHCPGDTVVWVNTRSHVYHFAGSPAFGHTKHGTFMCRADADRTGRLHAARNEQPPGTAASGSSTAPKR